MRMIIIFIEFSFYIIKIIVMKYQTKHRQEVIAFLKKNENRHLSIQEIILEMKGKVPPATLYRLMDSLVNEGVVRKYIIGPSSSACFQYNSCNEENEHFHLICEKCGRLFHLRCDEVNHLMKHISDEHGFSIDPSRINLYGLCEDCRKEDKQ